MCDELRQPADTEARWQLRSSASSTSLDVRHTRLSYSPAALGHLFGPTKEKIRNKLIFSTIVSLQHYRNNKTPQEFKLSSKFEF